MLEFVNRFFDTKYRSLNRIEISSDNLIHNYKILSNLDAGISVAPVLKSNAYGHGISIVGRVLDKLNPPFFCVDSIYEGYELLKAQVKSPILIMGYVNPENLKVKKLPFSYAIYDRDTLEAIHKYQPHAGIHIFVDTGMHREGVHVTELALLLEYVKATNGLKIDGLMSHFAAADTPGNPLTQNQADHFVEAQKMCEEFGIFPKWVHLAASSGLINHNKFKGKLGNMARVGDALYGIDPTDEFNLLKPVLSLCSTVVQVKPVRKSEKVGYDFTYTAQKDMNIGILPIGYNDGLDRRLSSKGSVYIKGQKCPIVGRISMNVTTVDVSLVPEVRVGDEVEVYSSESEKENSLSYAARTCGTIAYELMIHLNESIHRVVI